MENTHAVSLKTYQIKSKYSITLTKKPTTSTSPCKSLLSEIPFSSSRTPEPSLTIKLKTIHKRGKIYNSPRDYAETYNKHTKEALSVLIKNNAITMISPNDFINQIYAESFSQSSRKNSKNEAKTGGQKTKKNSENEKPRPGTVDSHRVYTSASGYRNEISKNIEITGCQIPKLIRKNHAVRHESVNAISKDISLLKVLNNRKAYKPVVFYNKQHNYFRQKHDDGIMRTTFGSNYYSLT